MGGVGECFVTFLANVRFFPVVSPQMLLEAAEHREFLVAEITFERIVTPRVRSQGGASKKRRRAMGATVFRSESLSRVNLFLKIGLAFLDSKCNSIRGFVRPPVGPSVTRFSKNT